MLNEIKRNEFELNSYAESQIIGLERSPYKVKKELIEMGMDENSANALVYKLKQKSIELKKSKATKDIIYGALWCFGGLILTIAKTGFIFWGAIVFGGYQLIKGVVNYSSNS